MTTRRSALADLPDWPRLMTQREAADYLRQSVNVFADGVRGGKWPAAVVTPAGDRWDRIALDDAVDMLSGRPSARAAEAMALEATRREAPNALRHVARR